MALGRLTAGILHDASTPLSALVANTATLRQMLDRLAESATEARAQRLIESMRALIDTDQLACQRLLELVRSVKTFARQGESAMAAADLEQILSGSIRLAAAAHKQRVEFVEQFGGVGLVECNAAEMAQVFLNLLVNAAEAIAVRGTVTVRSSREGGDAVVSIADTGAGIPEDVRGRVFEGVSTKPLGSGTGLGLSSAKRAVEQHHRGSLTFETETGKGTTFIVRIPVRAAAEGTPAKGGRAPLRH